MEVFIALISTSGIIVVAIINGIMLNDRKRVDARAEVRAKESRLSLALMHSTCKLCMVSAKAILGQKTNGDIAEALNAAKAADAEYSQFLKNLGMKHIKEV